MFPSVGVLAVAASGVGGEGDFSVFADGLVSDISYSEFIIYADGGGLGDGYGVGAGIFHFDRVDDALSGDGIRGRCLI